MDFMLARISHEVAEEHSSDILFRSASVIVAGVRNPLTRRRKIALSDLMNEPWVLGPLDSNFGMFQADVFRACGLATPRPTVSSVSTNLRNELLSNGRFLSVLPGFSLRLPRRHPWLRVLPVELPDTRMPVAIVTLKNRSPRPLASICFAAFSFGMLNITRPPHWAASILTRCQTPSLSAKSWKFLPTTSNCPLGSDSPVPGPPSPGRPIWPVRIPSFCADDRSPECAAHIITCSGLRLKASQVAR